MKKLIEINKDEMTKILTSSMLKEEKILLQLLKYTKLNRPIIFQNLLENMSEDNKKYIVSLLEKREGYDLVISNDASKCKILIFRSVSFIKRQDINYYNILKRYINI